MISQAVILAGGRGKRMGMETPKPLLEVNGMPIIERNIRKLAEQNVEIGVVVNPKEEKLFKQKLAEYEISYIRQDKPLGTAHALFCASKFVSESLFLVMMGDDITDYSIVELLSMGEPTVFGFEVNDVSNYGAVIADKNEIVEDIIEKQRSGKGIANTGVYIMPKSFFELYREIPVDEKSGEYFLTHFPRILREHGMGFRLRKLGYWLGINTQEELKRADEILRKRGDV